VQKPGNPNPISRADTPHYSCSSCMNLTQQPAITLECTDCEKSFRPDEAEYRQLFRIILQRSTARTLIKRIEEKFSS
jgi:hypothetical protein